MTTTALITGANKGIGYQTARLLGARGMTVLAGVRDADRGQEAERALRVGGGGARFVQLDVTDETSVARAVKLVEAEFGALDVLVNNAGIARGDGSGKPSQTTLATLRQVYETNVWRGLSDQRDAAVAAPLARRVRVLRRPPLVSPGGGRTG